MIEHLSAAVPPQSQPLTRDALEAMTARRADAWLLAGFGIAAALLSGSSYLSVFRRAVYAIHRINCHRPCGRPLPAS
ncbi:hypothetical protein [Nocardia cyriacigeorgica]|uniref:hypothetical protein n=1 Tax=Nocardia cyriacigeorgica TaxID=135487 RepID=UPI002454B49B|nr:hypothetical protein [Nocardia cyriacigeorgica]